MKGAVYVPLMSRHRVVGVAIIDAEDAVRVAAYRWHMVDGYAANATCGRMHRFVLGLKAGDRIVHHVNESKTDNRKANLEIFDTAAEANRAPHPKRDDPVRQAGYRRRADELYAARAAMGWAAS